MLIDPQKSAQMAEILGYIADDLDIPESIYQDARRKYKMLGEWLKADHLQRYSSDAEIYPQGSIRLGTSIRPVKVGDDYDIDLVYRRVIKKESTTQEELKVELGDQLRRYLQYLRCKGEAVPELMPGRRCWTLEYRGQFHMDVLPALPDDEAAQYNIQHLEDAIIITDTKLHEWQHSNPEGYAKWFNNQQKNIFLANREMMAEAAKVDVEEIPPERVATPLRRLVQVLKRHRDIRYQGSLDDKPISIIITTLAADAYRGQVDIFDALIFVISSMRKGIIVRDGVYWVPNPINPAENFAEKWQEHPERARIFIEWLSNVEKDLLEATRQEGIYKIANSLKPLFGEDLVRSGIEKYGNVIDKRQRQGQLRMSTGTGLLGVIGAAVPKNTWYGS